MNFEPLSFNDIKTYPLNSRASKVSTSNFARPVSSSASIKDFLQSLPDILAAKDLCAIVEAVKHANEIGRPVIWAMGAHVIKCGLSPLIIQLMHKGVINALALNGAGVIHDFELALSGQTSEDVSAQLESGLFGMAKETGENLNEAINIGAAKDLGLGEAVGEYLDRISPPFTEYSLLAAAYKFKIPVTVHVAIGTDITHIHPQADGAAIGKTSHQDFRLFAGIVSQMEGGGVFINSGSAVIMPEIFLKAVTLIRNLGIPLEDFVTVNMDFKAQYRPTQNIVCRPTAKGGKGYNLIGHHEILIPLIAAALTQD